MAVVDGVKLTLDKIDPKCFALSVTVRKNSVITDENIIIKLPSSGNFIIGTGAPFPVSSFTSGDVVEADISQLIYDPSNLIQIKDDLSNLAQVKYSTSTPAIKTTTIPSLSPPIKPSTPAITFAGTVYIQGGIVALSGQFNVSSIDDSADVILYKATISEVGTIAGMPAEIIYDWLPVLIPKTSLSGYDSGSGKIFIDKVTNDPNKIIPNGNILIPGQFVACDIIIGINLDSEGNLNSDNVLWSDHANTLGTITKIVPFNPAIIAITPVLANSPPINPNDLDPDGGGGDE